MTATATPRGRFAPSPTGRMHLGNLWAAFMSWLSVKVKGGEWILRIEDLDPQRSSMEWARWIEDDLHWLGLDWDEGGIADTGIHAPYTQSRRSAIYEKALRKLTHTGLTYPCRCTRADIMATQAPHQSDGRIVYAGTCRPPLPYRGDFPAEASIRLYVPDCSVTFHDMVCGSQTYNLATECGDFILRRKDGAWAYQLAVVADDADMGITEVVRGNDLLLSAAQQIHLYKLLELEPPAFGHIPLIYNQSGQRLSKRDQSCATDYLRAHSSPEEIIGLFASMAGLLESPIPTASGEILKIVKEKHPNFLENLPKCTINATFVI